MGIAALVIFYGSAAFCVIALVVKIARYINAPLHLRWELYSGSSVYEQPEWWNKPHRSFGDKLKSAMLDALLLREYYHRNRSFWYFLYLFHIGLYLLILWHAWLFISAATINIENAPAWGIVWGHVATALVFIGSVGILIKRIMDEDLRIYYPPIHYIKWVFIVLTLAGGFYVVYSYFGGDVTKVLEYINHQLAFEPASVINAPVASSLHLLLVALWLVYLPFSHMMKLFLRYYHHLRWDNKPNLRGSDVEQRVKELLGKPISWSAPHIQPGKRWSEVAVGPAKDTNGEGKIDEKAKNTTR